MKKLIKRSTKAAGVILGLCVIGSLFGMFVSSNSDSPTSHVVVNWSYIIILAFFCYSILAFVTEQGLFNGIRYSTKQVRTTLAKHHRNAYMDEFNINTKEQLDEHLKEKYLYERPKFHSTYPLLISSSVLFIIVNIIAFNI